METLKVAVERAFPDRAVESVAPQQTRPGNQVGRVRLGDGETVYVKTATDTTRRLVREAAATRFAAANCAIAVPEVLAADLDESPPSLVLAPLPGTPLNDPWTDDQPRAPLLRKAGRTLAAVHEAAFDAPGRIVGVDGADALERTDETWTETLCSTIQWRAEDWFADRFSDIPERLVDLVRELEPTLRDATPVLLHGDCSRINVHVDPEGLLDWERALVGDPAFDVVDAEGNLVEQIDVDDDAEPRLRTAFRDGYRSEAGSLPVGLSERRPLYRVFAHLLVPQTFEDWAPTVERPNDELAANVREEFASRVAMAREEMG